MKGFTRQRTRLLVAASALVGTIAFGSLFSTGAHAQLGVCYGDPLVYLDNGTVVDLTTGMQTDASNIQGVTYTLHIPVGVNVTAITYPGSSSNFETVIPVADAAPGLYTATTTVASTVTAPVITSEVVMPAWGRRHVNIAVGTTNNDLLTQVQF